MWVMWGFCVGCMELDLVVELSFVHECEALNEFTWLSLSC